MTLAEQLREETKSEHAATEKAMMPLLKSARDKDSYTRLLCAMYTYLKPVEDAVFRKIDTSHLPDQASRRTMGHMSNDLQALGSHDCTQNLAAELPVINTAAQAFGALYVLEGSTMGGQIVGGIVRKNLPQDLHHTRYFDSYGEQTRMMWGKFIGALNAFGEANPGTQEEVLSAARETFALFEKHLEAAKQG